MNYSTILHKLLISDKCPLEFRYPSLGIIALVNTCYNKSVVRVLLLIYLNTYINQE